jgi:hypothetical protein
VSNHSFFVFLLFPTCVHYLLERLGFTWYCLIVVPTLPIPQHGLFKALPSFVATCTPPGLAVKVTCMQDCRRRISPACIGQELLPFQLSTVYCAPPGGSTRKPGVIAWLLHCCCSLAVCAKDMAAARPQLIVAMNSKTLCLLLC